MVMPDFNPRTRFLNAEALAHAFSAEALEDLVSSMSELEDGVQRGVLMPLLVRPASPGKYWIVAGERRFHAARFAGLTEVPVIVRAFNDAQAEAAAIIENAQRENLDLVSETLNAFKFLSTLTGLDQPALILHLNQIRLGRVKDQYDLDRRLRILYGTGISTWSQTRSQILQLTQEEQLTLTTRNVDVKAILPLLKLGSRPERKALLSEFLNLSEWPSSQEVKNRVDLVIGKKRTNIESHLAMSRTWFPKLKKLSGERAIRAAKLLDELELLTRSSD